ncbi:hypothetical protein PanWU01x14_304160, partial [Parasponia andersonii]
DFNYILKKLEERLTGWKEKVLSRAGRLTLIKSMSLAIPLYTMQFVSVSLSICNKVDALIRKLWWGSNANGNRSLCLKSWDSLCKPKAVGGIGLRHCHDMNRALLRKWG